MRNNIALNLAFALRSAAQGSPCRVNVSDVKVRVEQADAYYYPDVVVGCEQDSSEAEGMWQVQRYDSLQQRMALPCPDGMELEIAAIYD